MFPPPGVQQYIKNTGEYGETELHRYVGQYCVLAFVGLNFADIAVLHELTFGKFGGDFFFTESLREFLG